MNTTTRAFKEKIGRADKLKMDEKQFISMTMRVRVACKSLSLSYLEE